MGAKRKTRKDPAVTLKEALSPDYEGTKEQRQKDLCESWSKVRYGNDPKRKKREGVVYTPVEITDFIINSVAYLTEKEFGVKLDSSSVEVVDPFAGTGIFAARMADLGYGVDNVVCHEIDPETAEVANRNISISAGKPYDGCKCLDTFGTYGEEEQNEKE